MIKIMAIGDFYGLLTGVENIGTTAIFYRASDTGQFISMKKIIINTPEITSPAGVSNHYLGLRDYFSNGVIYNQYKSGNYIRRTYSGYPRFIQVALRGLMLIRDITKFISLIIIHKKPVVLLNPSFGKTAMQRDAIFLRIAKFLGCKVAVFIHGWDKAYFNDVTSGRFRFDKAWQKADCFFVLASEFKQGLCQLGVKAPIHLTTTKVSDRLVDGFKREPAEVIRNILFLARVTKEKGIYVAIDAFEIIKKSHDHATLNVVGMGDELENAKIYVKKKGIPDITFTGPLSGKTLREEFVKADIYILPTAHGEGMPTSVLEAMAFSLPVVTRPIGGIIDFFEDGKMGNLVGSVDAKDYADRVISLMNSPQKVIEIGKYNEAYARANFMASNVASKLEATLRNL